MPKPSFFRLNKHYSKALIEQATKVFNSKDYHSLKVSDLSEGMGLPTGTFYEYFESKEDLCVYLASIAFQRKFDSLGADNIVLFTYEKEGFSIPSEDGGSINDISYEKILNCGVGFFARLFDEYLLEMMIPHINVGIKKKIEEGVYREDIDFQLSSYMLAMLSTFVLHYFDKYEISDKKDQEATVLKLVGLMDGILKK
ncbi:TetR/AcrR family transcriptional regulator [Lysinibacillus sp. NPDC097214]|uniref:TetR/AcrR family transcriptional regulator n=1 Tax=Lysinibacillus sp. NPDC097214 TaxID=3390584 RepID=UPI003D05669B